MSTAIAISRDKKLAKALRAGLLKGADEVTTATNVDSIPKNGKATLLAVHVDKNAEQQIRTCLARLPNDAKLIVVVPKSQLRAIATALQTSAQVCAVVTVDRATKATMSRVAAGLAHGDVFGLGRFLPDDSEVHSAVLGSYADKEACLEQLEAFAKTNQIRAKYRDAILQCTDEMLMNALYIAPREATTTSQIQLTNDKQSLVARAQRSVEVEYALTDKSMWVCVRDQYGSVQRRNLLDQWEETVIAHEDASDTGDHALGIYIMSNASTSMHVHLAPGVATEFVCSFDLKAAKLQLRELEIVEEQDAGRIAELKTARQLTAETSFADPSEGDSRSPIFLVAAVLAVVVAILVVALLLN